MSENLNISLSETEQFLQGKYGPGIADVKQLGEGAWSLAFAFVHAGVRKVIRWSNIADNFERDAVAARFNRDGLPVPPIAEIGRGGRHPGHPSPWVHLPGRISSSLCSSDPARICCYTPHRLSDKLSEAAAASVGCVAHAGLVSTIHRLSSGDQVRSPHLSGTSLT
jgi:hypothetical protein